MRLHENAFFPINFAVNSWLDPVQNDLFWQREFRILYENSFVPILPKRFLIAHEHNVIVAVLGEEVDLEFAIFD